MLVFRPQKKLLSYKGFDIILKSNNATEDEKKFDDITFELRIIIESILKEIA